LSGNIEIITRFEHAFRAADQATIDELCDPGLVDHNPAPGHEPTLAGFKQKVAGFKAIFPDLEEDLQDIIASDDTVATRWAVTGSQQQEFMTIPGSGQKIRVEGMNFYRLKDGRVTDIWTQFDGVAMMQQLGAIALSDVPGTSHDPVCQFGGGGALVRTGKWSYGVGTENGWTT
jgi:steroid delta-isomerase-like uncharacterized protein